MSSYRGRPVTEAVITLLTAAGLRVGDGEKPDASGWVGTHGESQFRNYVVVHPMGAFDIDGSIDAPSDDVWPLCQLTSYGATSAGCETTADAARAAMLAALMSVTGRASVRWEIDLVGVATRVDNVQPPIFMAPDRYTAFSTPS